MRKDQMQIFRSDIKMHCDAFMCYEPATWLIGRPDGPINLATCLCDKHFDEVVESISPEPEIVEVENFDEIEKRLDRLRYAGSGWYWFPDEENKIRAPENFKELLMALISTDEGVESEDE